MDLTPFAVAIGHGDGLVARVGDLVMFIADPSGAAPLMRALESASTAAIPGRALAKALAAAALGPDSGLVSPFGVVAPADDGLMLLLRGGVAAHVEGGGAIRTLTGDRALTWVDETVPEPIDAISLGVVNAPSVIARPHSDLRSGVVPGGGFVLQRSTITAGVAHAAPAAPAARADPEAPASPPALAREDGGEQTRAVPRQPRPPAPADRPQAAPPPTRQPDRPRQPPQPRPVAPKAPAGPTAVPRQVIGVLADDEATYPLDRSYVLGRNPLTDASVRDASASPIVLPDDPQISRIHAYLTVVAGAVMLRDAGTAAGTFIAAPGDTAWIRLGDRPAELKPGWCLRIGQRIMVYRNGTPAQ